MKQNWRVTMEVKYFDQSRGIISEIEANGVKVPFYEEKGPVLYCKENGERKDISLFINDG